MANLVLIRDLCVNKKMTIRELAQKIGRNESTIQAAIRKGTTNTNTIELIAKALGVPAGIFFDDYNDSAEVAKLRRDLEHMKELVKEKERTIEILMADRKK